MPITILNAIYGLWWLLGTVWAIGALRTKPSTRAQDPRSRAIHLGLLGASGALLFWKRAGAGFLGWTIVPSTPAFEWTGLLLTAIGVALAIWARVFLGGNWSATPTVKEHHKLIRSGPYRIVRHPIYSGCLLAMLGTALVIGEVRGFAGCVLALVTWWYKSRVEEEFMTQQFGAEYTEYKREVKALIPYVL